MKQFYAKLYCKKSKVMSDGKAPIYIVLRMEGSKAEKLISTGKSVAGDNFDNATGMVLKGEGNSMKLNRVLQNELSKIEGILLDLEAENIEPSFDLVLAKYKGGNDLYFYDFAFAELDRERSFLSKRTVEQYEQNLKQLKVHKPNLTIRGINRDFLVEYRSFLIQKGLKPNSYYHNFTSIRKFYMIALEKGLAKGNPFKKFGIKMEETERDWLRPKELDTLETLFFAETLSPKLQRTLANFLYSCFTGINFGNMLTKQDFNIQDGQLVYRRHKTDKLIRLSLTKRAERIILAISGGDYQLKLSNSKVNEDLKTIMAEAKINRHITFHCARHTFAVNSLMKGVNIYVIKDSLGHKSIKTTEIYLSMHDEFRNTEMAKWD